jgi:hypothetical protein
LVLKKRNILTGKGNIDLNKECNVERGVRNSKRERFVCLNKHYMLEVSRIKPINIKLLP